MFKLFFRRNKKRKKLNIPQEDPFVETAHRRSTRRGSIQHFVQGLWSTIERHETVERILRKHALRTRKDEEVQQREAEINTRNAQLEELYKSNGFQILKAFLQKIEVDAYYSLRHPEIRSQGVSIEYFAGMQNGRIETVEDIRTMFSQTLLAKAKEREKLNQESVKEEE